MIRGDLGDIEMETGIGSKLLKNHKPISLKAGIYIKFNKTVYNYI
jgi:hypothetical protein